MKNLERPKLDNPLLQVYDYVHAELCKLDVDGHHSGIDFINQTIDLDWLLTNGIRIQILALYDGDIEAIKEMIMEQIYKQLKQT